MTAGLLALMLLAGCGKEGKTEDDNDRNEPGSDPVESNADYVKPDFDLDGKITLSWMMPTQNMLSCAQTPVMEYVAEKFNVVLEMTEMAPADHDVQLELNISNGQIKNIVTRIESGLANEYGSYGAFLDLRPYIENGYMPNVKAMIDKALEENPNNASYIYDEEGHMFRIPNYDENPMPNFNFSYNKSAFAAVGYEEPKTWDDVYNALVAIKAGRSDFYPFKMRSLGTNGLGTQLTNFIISFTGGYANGQEFIGYDASSDEFVFGMDVPGYKEAIRFFNKMYNAGLIDPGYSTMSITAVFEAMKSGECVMTCDFMGGITGVAGYEDYTAAFVPMSLPQAEGQQQIHGFRISQCDRVAGTAVNAEVSDNPVLLGRVLQILDYMYSPEFIQMQWFYPDITEGSYPEGESDPTKYIYEKNGDEYVYKESVYSFANLSDTQNKYFNWGIYANFYNLNDPVVNKNISPYDSYYAFRDQLIREQEKYVDIPAPIFKASEYKKVQGCETNLTVMYSAKIADLLTGRFESDEAFETAWQSALEAIKSQGGDTLVEQYNTAYQRMK